MGVESTSVEPDPSAVTVSGGLAFWVTDSRAVGGFSGGGATENATCSNAAAPAFPSYAQATRRPVPVMMTASAFPLDHPGRLTISWTSAERSGVRSLAPTSPAVQDPGVQVTTLEVRGRL